MVNKKDVNYVVEFNYVKCNNCDFIYLNPVPSEESLDFFYSYKNYYSQLPIEKKYNYEKKLQKISNLKREKIINQLFNVKNSTNILDVGCGNGEFLIHMYNKYKCFAVGIDKDIVALESLKNNDSV